MTLNFPKEFLRRAVLPCVILTGITLPVVSHSSESTALDARNEIARYYSDMSCNNGKFGAGFASHFWPGATITTIWKGKGDDQPRVLVMSVPEFIAQTPEGACSQPIFEENMNAAEVKIHNGLAQVWAHYQARFGKPGSVEQWEGIDAFTLLQHKNRWKIVSLAFRAESNGP